MIIRGKQLFQILLTGSGALNILFYHLINPFAPGDFAQKRVLKLVEWFSGHCGAIKLSLIHI